MFGKYDGMYDLIHLYTKGEQKVLIDDNTKGIIIENGDGQRTIELSEDKKLISIKNTDSSTKIEIDSVGEITIKGTVINLEGDDIMINGESLVDFMAGPPAAPEDAE